VKHPNPDKSEMFFCHKGTNVSNQLSVISNQFALTDHFSLITVHQWLSSCLSVLVAMRKSFATKYTKIMTKVLRGQGGN
jgi:hypothetical protein